LNAACTTSEKHTPKEIFGVNGARPERRIRAKVARSALLPMGQTYSSIILGAQNAGVPWISDPSQICIAPRSLKHEPLPDTIKAFLSTSPDAILGKLSAKSEFGAEQEQIGAWSEEIRILKDLLSKHEGSIYFEFPAWDDESMSTTIHHSFIRRPACPEILAGSACLFGGREGEDSRRGLSLASRNIIPTYKALCEVHPAI